MARERGDVEEPLRHVLRAAATSSCAASTQPALLGVELVRVARSSSTAMRSDVSGVPQLVRERRHELLAPRLLVAQVGDVLQRQDQARRASRRARGSGVGRST